MTLRELDTGLDAAATVPVLEGWKTVRRLVRAGRPANAPTQIDTLAQAHPTLAPARPGRSDRHKAPTLHPRGWCAACSARSRSRATWV